MVSSIHFLHYIVSAYLRQVKFAFCCDFLYFRSANIYSPKKGARCCNKSLTSSVLSFVVMYKRGVVMFGVVSLTMGNSIFPAGHRFVADAQQHRQLFLCQFFLFPQFGNEFSDFDLIHAAASFHCHCIAFPGKRTGRSARINLSSSKNKGEDHSSPLNLRFTCRSTASAGPRKPCHGGLRHEPSHERCHE